MSLLIQFIAAAVVLAFAPNFLPGVRVRDSSAAITAAVVFAIVAVLLGGILKAALVILTLPATVVTLGLFLFFIPWIVNTVLLKITAGLVDSFDIDDWQTAFVLSFLYSLAVYVVRSVIG